LGFWVYRVYLLGLADLVGFVDLAGLERT